ncbi:MAG: hypothetical protein LBO00_07790 [Zoogloeaceae bacterium]|jgi:hypothetical protein|nr:hypothetical protein [Zoogloeaceae bacterium]
MPHPQTIFAPRRLPCLALPLVALAFFLSGCTNDSAAYHIDGARHALSVERRQDYFWEKQMQLSVIVARLPECQRKHILQKTGARTAIELWQPGPGTYIFKIGQRAYVTETRTCQGFARLEEDPPGGYGDLLGTFRVVQGVFSFVPEKAREAPAASPETQATTPPG